MTKRKILVTGGAGYIGSHTSVELINEGFDVIIVDNFSNSSVETLEGIEEITGIRPTFECLDLCQEEKVKELFRKHSGIEAVIHFAAFKAVGESVVKPLQYYSNNLISLMNLLWVINENPAIGLVFSSSCTVYGQPDVLPVTEDAAIKKAKSPYGNTKQIAEEMIKDVSHANSMIKAIALRYFNPIGAHKSALIGEWPLGVPQNLVPFITQTAIGLREELKVFGNDYDTSDGSCVRDYIHVVDLAKAHVVAVKRLIEKKNKTAPEVFNLGTGRGVSVLEIINAFEKSTGVNLNYQIVGRREGDIEKVWADTRFANEELGWQAKETIEDTLLSAWNWQLTLRDRGLQ